jgi:hypothetical protein
VRDSPDQAAHYQILGLHVRGFISDPALDWSQSSKYTGLRTKNYFADGRPSLVLIVSKRTIVFRSVEV